MPILNWIGKEKVINHHLDVPYKVLERKYDFYDDEQYIEEKYYENKIIRGDNLEALKALLPQYEGKIDCIYIDPPYNTGNEKWVYNDNVNDSKIRKWLGEVVGKEGEDLSRHDKWLCMMYPRLKLLQKLLANDGAIFISIDDNEQANLKLICDEIFGASNFISEMIWQKRKGGGNDSFFIGVDHEYIIVYAKDKTKQNKKWRIPYSKDYLKRYKYEDEKGRYYYDTLSRPGLNNPIIYDVECPDGSIIKNGTWQISESTFRKELEMGEVNFIENKNGGFTVVHKVRMPEGRVFRSILNEVSNKDAADEMEKIFGSKKEFSTPKPVKLITDLISLSANKDAIILDSFAGSGTTAHAVLNLNKEDSGKRKFILVEMEEYAENITAERVRRVIRGYNGVEGTGGNFSFYDLGEPLLIENDCINENIPLNKIREYVYFMETKQALHQKNDNYYLDSYNDIAYYFYYEKDSITTLNYEFLRKIEKSAERYVIYADVTTLSEDELLKYNITFKKIPRDIARL